MRRTPALILCFSLLCACSPQANLPQIQGGLVDAEARKQQEMALRDYMAKEEQLYRVGWKIRAQNVELCGEKAYPRIGVNFATAEDFPKDQRTALSALLGVGDRLTISQLTPGAPAQAAGMQKGDILLEVGNIPVATKKEATAYLDKLLVMSVPVAFTIERAGVRQEITVAPAKICGYDLRLKQDPSINAFADGEHITVMTGMMKFVKSDDELAAILGHEMAHNTQGHIKAKTANAVLGSILDITLSVLTRTPNMNSFQAAGGAAFSQGFESEADYVGLYYTARAGYDIHNVPDLWRRMAVENPGAITMGSTHPSTSQRFVALEAAAAEIDAKRQAGAELKPEMKTAQK